ncbi:MAG: diadenylate cyclase CdaA [Clostridia bacterium]|nr:diadenylate cyclase CdaA [Clostridia bacterium]
METVQTFLLKLKDLFMNYNWLTDTLDILLVALIAYGIIIQLRKSQSIQVIKGLALVVVVYLAISFAGMKTSSYIFSKLFNDIIVIFVILFAPEIRQVLETVGKRKIRTRLNFFSSSSDDEEVAAINAICRACGAMSESKVGSLIIFQRNSLLGDLTKHSVPIDAETTFEMICSIFYPKAPLHDGAVIIKNGRIVAARCVVPMKNDREISGHVGTRHRAAIEVSLNSDAVAVVTSEETGIISLAVDGQLRRGLTDSELREQLGILLLNGENDKSRRWLDRRKRGDAPEAEVVEAVPADVSGNDTEALKREGDENDGE